MSGNVGKIDRFVRVIIGIVALLFVPQTAWALLGLVPLVTGLVGWCPLYAALGISSRPKQKTAY